METRDSDQIRTEVRTAYAKWTAEFRAGSERGLEYDTLSDRFVRFINEDVLPAVEAKAEIKSAHPGFKLTTDPEGRAALGCSSGYPID